jgi:stage II sporulation protein M
VRVLGSALRRIAPATLLMVLIAGVSIWMSYDWIIVNVSKTIAVASPATIEKIAASVGKMPDVSSLKGKITAPFLFLNNTRAVILIFFAGLFSFSVLGVLLYMVNIGLLGGVFALLQLLGLHPWSIFLAGVVPHGIFEIPALMIGSAVALYIGASIVTPQTGKSMGEVILELIADWLKIFLGVVVPLLAVAALIEAYVTPGLLLGVMGK